MIKNIFYKINWILEGGKKEIIKTNDIIRTYKNGKLMKEEKEINKNITDMIVLKKEIINYYN